MYIQCEWSINRGAFPCCPTLSKDCKLSAQWGLQHYVGHSLRHLKTLLQSSIQMSVLFITATTRNCPKWVPLEFILFLLFRETVKDREAWHAAVHRVTKSQTGLSDWTRTSSGCSPPSQSSSFSLQNSHHSEQKRLQSFSSPFPHLTSSLLWRRKCCLLWGSCLLASLFLS